MASRLLHPLIISHELLHLAGFRLIGKAYHYRWGEPAIEPAVALTRREASAVALLPIAVSFPLFVASTVGVALTLEAWPGWPLLFLVLTILSGIQAGFCLDDLRRAWSLITGRETTPFDKLIQLNEGLMQPRPSLLHIWLLLIGCLILLLLELR